jgi:hypothetical protein
LFPKNKAKPKNDRFSDLNGPTEVSDDFKVFGTVHYLMKELGETEKEIYKKNYISCLNWLSYFYQRDKAIEAKHKNSI